MAFCVTWVMVVLSGSEEIELVGDGVTVTLATVCAVVGLGISVGFERLLLLGSVRSKGRVALVSTVKVGSVGVVSLITVKEMGTMPALLDLRKRATTTSRAS